MLGHSVSYYLPSFWATTPLYAEKIIPLLDTYLSVGAPNADKLALAYYDILNKYTRPEDLTTESMLAFIRDHGYGYILKLISNSSTETLKNLLLLLPIIAYLKDSKLGVEVVLSLLQPPNSEISVVEWWEANPVGVEDTFDVNFKVELNNVSDTFLEDFDDFIKKYVHPTLNSLRTSYSIPGSYTLLPVVTIFNTIDLKRRESMDD